MVHPKSWGNDVTLFSFPIPGAGFTLGNVASFGASIELVTGVHSSFLGKLSAGVTFQGSTEDSAVTMDLLKKDNNKFDGSTFNLEKPEYSLRELANAATIKGNLGLKASLGFKLGVDGGLGEARAQIVLPLPQLSLTLTPKTRKYPKGL